MYLFHTNSYVRSYEKHMFELNKNYWADSTVATQEDHWIYVYHQWQGDISGLIYEDIVSKGLQAKTGLPIMSITYNTDHKRIRDLDDSFRIEKNDILNPFIRKGLISKIRTYIAAHFFSWLTYGKKKKLFQMKYRGISCGDFIHDSIVHEYGLYGNSKGTSGEQFDCFDVDQATYFQYIQNALSVVDQSYLWFKKHRPSYIVASDWIEISGLFMSVASRMGAELIVCNPGYWKNILQVAPGKEVTLGDMLKRQVESALEKCPQMRQEDKNLFLYKTEATSEKDLAKNLGLDPNKKNVFIMPHIMIDAPRRNCRHDVYNEYHEWFLDTLRIIREIPDVNWIVKDHPVSTHYWQDAYIKSVFEKNKTDNIYWCDKAVSGMQIKEIADCVITCAGEVGLEYWAYGIPTVVTSKGYFCDWGISYQMKTLSEYEDTLRHIGNLKPPSQQSVAQARRYLEAYKHMNETEDPLSRLFLDAEQEKIEWSKKGGLMEDRRHFIFCKRYMELLKGKKIVESTLYQLEDSVDLI